MLYPLSQTGFGKSYNLILAPIYLYSKSRLSSLAPHLRNIYLNLGEPSHLQPRRSPPDGTQRLSLFPSLFLSLLCLHHLHWGEGGEKEEQIDKERGIQLRDLKASELWKICQLRPSWAQRETKALAALAQWLECWLMD
uniref:Uncharacterized protein n=1 Tax=Pipistrellus kuhlii TaxID=59472 RepID=A0A7J8A7J4_PIPKU|nr:hypothetical protein mPipKuh1_008857 [Pipistrellus kuhlii]